MRGNFSQSTSILEDTGYIARVAFVMDRLYALGIICGILYALILKGTKYKGVPVPFVMELPNYRFPSAKIVWQLIVEKAKGFTKKAFTIIFVASLVIWFLQTFDIRLNVAASAEESLLALLGGVVAPLFAPLGFGDWRVEKNGKVLFCGSDVAKVLGYLQAAKAVREHCRSVKNERI